MNPYEPERLPLGEFDWRRFRRLVGPANAALARYDGILNAIINPEVLLSPLMTQEAVLSSRIEGTQATLEEVLEFEASEEARPERADEFWEVLNYRSAMRHAVESMKKRPICLNLMREAHEILLSGVRGRDKARGEFRREQNYIAKPGFPIEQAIYVPPNPQSVEKHLRNLEAYIHHDEDDRLVQLAVVHAQFELIHPFLDGNGRLGRMLLPLFMYEKGLLSSPMFYLSEYLESHRDQYYDRLGAVSRSKDWEGWIEFFLTAIIEQAKVNTHKARRILDLYGTKKTKVADLTHSQYAIRAVDALFMSPVFTSTLFIKRSGIPAATAKRILRVLTAQRVLDELRPGAGRSPAYYIFSKLIAITERKGDEGEG
jgi:Fic family protein